MPNLFMNLTSEQKAILTDFQTGKDIRINAFAGCGKTTILRTLVEEHPNKKFLVLSFNRSVVQELSNTFPSNAEIRTTHSFAYRKVKRFLEFKRLVPEKSLIPIISERFNLNNEISWFVIKLFSEWCHSDMKNITIQNVLKLIKDNPQLKWFFKKYTTPKKKNKDKNNKKLYNNIPDILKDGEEDKIEENRFEFEEERPVLTFKTLFRVLININIDISEWKMPMFHNYYLKYFQVHIEFFLSSINYDAILLDEWQDTNMVTLDIFKNILWQKVIVGDTHQGIYGWRWAINALDKVDYVKKYISTSFRLCDNTATKANFILQNYNLEENYIKPFFPNGSISNGKNCTIFRSNSYIIKYITFSLKDDEEVNFVRNIDDIFEVALQMSKIYKYYITWDKSFIDILPNYLKIIVSENSNWEKFKEYIVENIEDRDLITASNLVEKISIYKSYQKAKSLHNYNSKNYISTAHTVKWLEFDHVIIEDDFWDIFESFIEVFIKWKWWTVEELESVFFDPIKRNQQPMRTIVEEINLMYVSITRAIKTLEIKSKAIDHLLRIPRKDFVKHIKYLISILST